MEEPKPKSGATLAALKEVVEEMHSTGVGEKTRKFNAALIAEYRATGGRSIGEMPVESTVLLTIKGAKSGIARITPIGIEVIDGRLIVVASMAGLPKHPQWYHNIVANPTVTVEWRGETFRARAVVTEGADREHLFSKLNDVFRAQQAQTTRVFPVIELRRIDDVGASRPIANQTAQRFDDWHAIQTLIMVYAELVDAGRFAEAAALFEHATYRLGFSMDGGSNCASFRGAAEVNAHMARTPLFPDGTPRTRHVHTNLIVELQGDSATSRCYVTVFQQTDTFPLQPIAVGGYVDRFERVDGRWRFADRLVTSALVGNVNQHQAKA